MKTRTNFIARDIVIKAPRERVWKAIQDPDTMAKWFFNGWRGDWKVGGLVWFIFEGYGEIPVVMTEISDSKVGFAWSRFDEATTHPSLDDLALRVTFEAETHPDGTLLKVQETGYDNMTEEDYSKEFPDHEQGWTSELAELVALVEAA